MMKMTGSFWTGAKLVPSCAAAVLVEPSPTHVRATRGSFRSLKPSAIPAVTGTTSPTCEIGCSTPYCIPPTCRSRPADGESALPRYARSMSTTGIPSSQHAAALRIIGATTSLPRSSACTGPTVVASSPVPSHALEMTPVLTQRFSWMSCNRARSNPAYSARWSSSSSCSTIARRSASPSTVPRNARTSAGSGFQSTYSGGSNAGKRRMRGETIRGRTGADGPPPSASVRLCLGYSAIASPHHLPIPLEHAAALHDEVHVLQHGDVLQRITFHGDQVGELARGDRTDLVLAAEQRRAAQRAGDDRLHRRHAAVAHHQLELARVGAVTHHAGVGPQRDLDARGHRQLERLAGPRRDLQRLRGDDGRQSLRVRQRFHHEPREQRRHEGGAVLFHQRHPFTVEDPAVL